MPVNPGKLICAGILALAALVVAPVARAEEQQYDPEYMIWIWPKWQKGVELGARALGRFGAGTNINSPPGDLMVQGQYHLWYQHLIDLHLNLGLGISSGTFMYGGGVRVNLIEFIEDPTKEMLVRGLQRGLLGKVLKNFMLFFGAEYLHFSFPQPGPGLNYAASEWKLIPEAGAQWYFFIPQNFAGRFYLETSIGYGTFGGSKYLTPVFSLGAELL